MDFDRSTSTRPLGVQVIEAVADAENEDRSELTPLDAVVDVRALDAVFRGRDQGGVTVGYEGYAVTVRNGDVAVQERPSSPEYDSSEAVAGADACVTSFDDDRGAVCTAVVSAVAAVSGMPRLGLPPLYAAVDPDALAALVAPTPSRRPDRHVSVSFVFDNHPVTVESGGFVAVERSNAVESARPARDGALEYGRE